MTEMRTDFGHEDPTPVVLLTDRGTCRVSYNGQVFVEVPHCPERIFSALAERDKSDSPGVLLRQPLYIGDIPDETRSRVAALAQNYNALLNPTLELLKRDE